MHLAFEKVETAGDFFDDLLRGEGFQPRRRQQDTERQTIDQATNARHPNERAGIQLEVTADTVGALQEELDRTVFDGIGGGFPFGEGHAAEDEDSFGVEVELFAGGDEDFHVGSGLEDLLDNIAPGDDVLVVVHNEQDVFGVEVGEQLLLRVAPILLEIVADGFGNHAQNMVGRQNRGEVNEVNAMLEQPALRLRFTAGTVEEPARDFEREASFAHAAMPDDGKEAHGGVAEDGFEFG